MNAVALIALVSTLPGITAQAQIANDVSPCGNEAVVAATVALKKSLTPQESADAVIELVDINLVKQIETFPVMDVLDVTLETNLPGWVKYQVEVQEIDGLCRVVDVGETDSE